MALVVGTNSYADVAAADAFLADRYGTTDWDALSNADKEKALVSATDILDTLCDWWGTKTDSDQSLAFPVDGDTDTPNDIIYSCIEIALEITKQAIASFVSAKKDLKTLKGGPAVLSFYEALSTPITVVNSTVKARLARYGICSFGGGSIQSAKLER